MPTPEPMTRWSFTEAPLIRPTVRSLANTLISFATVCAFLGLAVVGFALIT